MTLRSARWVATTVAGLILVVSLSACRDHGIADANTTQTPSASIALNSAGAGALPQPSAGSSSIAPPPSNASAALAQVSADLSGIDAGASQAGNDLGAGDSARTQPDDGN